MDEVNDLLNDIRTGIVERGGASGKCIFITKVETLPDPLREAVLLAVQDRKGVSNTRLFSYINAKSPGIEMSLTCINRHRSKHGCPVCGTMITNEGDV